MANKRMLSADIIKSSAFMMQSHKAQILYVQMVMDADDDGLVDNVPIIIRGLATNQSALDELLENRFVLDLGDGIYCIKHWFINNSKIRTDRYKQSNYPEKLDLLIQKPNKAYTFKSKYDAKCLTNVIPMSYQVSDKCHTVGKPRIE